MKRIIESEYFSPLMTYKMLKCRINSSFANRSGKYLD